MMKRLTEFLESNGIVFEMFHHRADFRARETASDTGTPSRDFAKTVFVNIDGRFAMAVLPATHTVSPARLAESLDADDVRLATEAEMKDLCPDAEVGAAPPFGNLFDLSVYVCPALARDEHITFNAGTHSDAVKILYADFDRLVTPMVVHMSKHEEEFIG